MQMAEFVITLSNGEELTYSTDPCSMVWRDGSKIDLTRFAYAYTDCAAPDNDQIAFNPESPVVGKVQPRVLKVQIGLGCNYSCSYCSQGGQVEDKSSAADASEFLAGLDGWLTSPPDKIEFWGGEPTLYWHKMERLAPELRRRFQQARMSMVTNGSLLTMARAQWLYDLGFTVAVSHDGPGQSLRGADPFANSEWAETMRAVFKLFGERICFNTVITPMNHDLLEIIMWFEARMGFEVKVNIEDVVTDYGGASWSQAELSAMAASVRGYMSSGLALFFPRLRWSMQQFMESLAIGKPLGGSHQVCGMDRKDQLAVDLHGNVLTCQNAGAESGHRIGSIHNLDGVRLNTSRSWAARPNCHECPVVHLCYGSCMFLGDREFKSSCHASYHYNHAILSGIVKLLTGEEVKSISGWKPATQRVIQIKEIA
jgi:uncharacterized protein